jgi:hypothetical protein
VEEGSFNCTTAAESKNAENILVLNGPTIAMEYGREGRLLAESEDMVVGRWRDRYTPCT